MNTTPHYQVVEPFLQGRAGPMPNYASQQGFCSLTSSLADLTLIEDFVELTPGWATGQERSRGNSLYTGCSRMWNVSLRGTEIYRSSADGLTPLSRPIIENGPTPAGAARSENIHAYRARIKCSTETGYAVFDIDFNQDLEIWAQRIEVTILGPANAVMIPSNSADLPTVTRSQFVVDSVFACQIVPIEISKGCREARLTEYLRSPAATQSLIRVPRSAKSVKIYQGEPNSAAPTLRWNRLLGTPALAAITMGGINFAGRESIDASAPIGSESHLQTDIEPLSARLFVLNWTIRP